MQTKVEVTKTETLLGGNVIVQKYVTNQNYEDIHVFVKYAEGDESPHPNPDHVLPGYEDVISLSPQDPAIEGYEFNEVLTAIIDGLNAMRDITVTIPDNL